jgi:hypothetical protein
LVIDLARLIGTTQAARLLGLSEQRVRQLAADGRLPVAHRTVHGSLFDPAVVAQFAAVRAAEREARS